MQQCCLKWDTYPDRKQMIATRILLGVLYFRHCRKNLTDSNMIGVGGKSTVSPIYEVGDLESNSFSNNSFHPIGDMRRMKILQLPVPHTTFGLQWERCEQMLTRTIRQKFFLQAREVQNIPLSSLIQVPSQSKPKYIVKNGVNDQPIRREFSLKTALD